MDGWVLERLNLMNLISISSIKSKYRSFLSR